MAEPASEGGAADNGVASARARPIKGIPTDRLTFDRQLSVLLAYAAAAGNERAAVSITDVGTLAKISPDTVSLCNPFFRDLGLIVREGYKFRPTDLVFDFLHANQWNPDTAPLKLRPAIEGAWFSKTLLSKLLMRSLSKAEALQFLADEAKASKAYENHLSLILDYMRAVGLISMENNTISLVLQSPPPDVLPSLDESARTEFPVAVKPVPTNTQVFSIPIPGKDPATITVPVNIDAEDWSMLQAMIATYVKRWKGFKPEDVQGRDLV